MRRQVFWALTLAQMPLLAASAQSPTDSTITSAVHRVIESEARSYGTPCQYSRDFSALFMDDTIIQRGALSNARDYMPFRAVASGVAVCRSGGAATAYPFRFQVVVRFKPDEFDEWKFAGYSVEGRPAAPRTRLDADSVLAIAMRGILRRLVTAEEAYFAEHSRYTTRQADLAQFNRYGVALQSLEVLPKGDGWRAVLESPVVSLRCGVAVNTSNPIVLAAPKGAPACQ